MSAILDKKKYCIKVSGISVPNKALCEQCGIDFTCACLRVIPYGMSLERIGYIIETKESNKTQCKTQYKFIWPEDDISDNAISCSSIYIPDNDFISELLSNVDPDVIAMLDIMFRIPDITNKYTEHMLLMKRGDITKIQDGIDALHDNCPLHNVLRAIHTSHSIKDVCLNIQETIRCDVVDLTYVETGIWPAIHKYNNTGVYNKNKYLIAFCKPFPGNPYPNVPLCVGLDYETTKYYVKTWFLCSKKNRCFEFYELRYVGYATPDECCRISEVLINAQKDNDRADYNAIQDKIISLVSERYLFADKIGRYPGFIRPPTPKYVMDNAVTLRDVVMKAIGPDSRMRQLFQDNNMSVMDVDELLDCIIHCYIPSVQKSARK